MPTRLSKRKLDEAESLNSLAARIAVLPIFQTDTILRALYYNGAKSGFLNKIFAAKERKEHMDKNLCCLFFAIFALFCGQFILVAAMPLQMAQFIQLLTRQ